jgi:hypothetical protein
LLPGAWPTPLARLPAPHTYSVAFTTADFVGDAEGWTWDEFLNAADDMGLYANLHTVEFPGGAIRGQIMAVPDLTYTANLNGENQVPEPVDTTATASFKLMQDGEEYMYELTVLGAYRCADRLYRRHRCERHMLARPAWPRLPAAAWGPSQPALPPGASGWSEGCPAPTVAPAPAAAQALRA